MNVAAQARITIAIHVRHFHISFSSQIGARQYHRYTRSIAMPASLHHHATTPWIFSTARLAASFSETLRSA